MLPATASQDRLDLERADASSRDSVPGNVYTNISVSGSGKLHAGDVNTYYNYDPKQYLATLSYARGSTYSSSSRLDDRDCLPGTRVEILAKIREWSENQSDRSMFWVNGMAGTGKSTIARTLARQFDARGQLGASFFFSRSEADTSHTGKLYQTIATQLAEFSTDLKSCICNALEKDPGIIHKSEPDQWQKLVIEPLSVLKSNQISSPLCIVLDALDECSSKDQARLVVKLLTQTYGLNNIKVRILVTSRPEFWISSGFSRLAATRYHELLLHMVSPNVMDDEISIFIRHELTQVKEYRTDCDFPLNWPGESTIRTLVNRTAGLYIYAATVCRFINAPLAVHPDTRLATILKGDARSHSSTRHLDSIYLSILEASVAENCSQDEKEEMIRNFTKVVGFVIVLSDPLSLDDLADLLRYDDPRSEITPKMVLQPLHSVLNIPSTGAIPIRLLHPSFREFLIDGGRCTNKEFWIDEVLTHSRLAKSCLKLMSQKLKRNICNLSAPDASAASLGDVQITQFVPFSLQYACQYWVGHVTRGKLELVDNGQVHTFLGKHFLHWLEVLSLVDKLDDGFEMIMELQPSLEVSLRNGNGARTDLSHDQKCPHLSSFVQDCKRFMLAYQPILLAAPLQAYVSALLFSPSASKVRRAFIDQLPTWIRAAPLLDEDWDACTSTLQGHFDDVIALAFSPSGDILASASNYDVRLWITRTGRLRTTLNHPESVNAVQFSADGRLLASGSGDGTIRLWDVTTGDPIQRLVGDDGPVKRLLFLPDQQRIASISADSTIQIWDVATGVRTDILGGHTATINTLSLSPSGQLLASGADDGTVRLWTTEKVSHHTTFAGHEGAVVAVTFSSDGKLLASASLDNTLRLWNVQVGGLYRLLGGHTGWVLGVQFSPNNSIVASCSMDRTVQLWDVEQPQQSHILLEHSDGVQNFLFSTDGKSIISGTADGLICCWDLGSGTLRSTYDNTSLLCSLAMSMDGQLLATGWEDTMVRLLDMQSFGPSTKVTHHESSVDTLMVSPDGDLVVSSSGDNNLLFWNLNTGECIRSFDRWRHMSLLCFSPDSSQLMVSGLSSTSIYALDIATGMLVHSYEGHTDRITTLVFSPDAQLIAGASREFAASTEEAIYIWRVGDTQPFQKLRNTRYETLIKTVNYDHHQYLEHWGSTPIFSANGHFLGCTQPDGRLQLWDTRSGELHYGDEAFEAIDWDFDSRFPERLYTRGSLSLDTDSQWVLSRDTKIVQFPPQYQASKWVSYGNRIVLGCRSGRVLIISVRAGADYHI